MFLLELREDVAERILVRGRDFVLSVYEILGVGHETARVPPLCHIPEWHRSPELCRNPYKMTAWSFPPKAPVSPGSSGRRTFSGSCSSAPSRCSDRTARRQ